MTTMEKSIKLKTLNCHITCTICKGYFINAVTVKECLHTFCKSCLVKHLKVNNWCPTCEIVIHESFPLQHICFDRTMQDIVFKLVPKLQSDEMDREREFCKIRGLPLSKEVSAGIETNDNKTPRDLTGVDYDYHRTDEQVIIELECVAPHLKPLKKKYLRLSSQATIRHLKKFIAIKIFDGSDRDNDIDILCRNELLGKDHTLKFIYVTRWRFRKPPLKLQFRPKLDL